MLLTSGLDLSWSILTAGIILRLSKHPGYLSTTSVELTCELTVGRGIVD